MPASDRHTLTVTESNFQLTLLSGATGSAGADGADGATGAAGPNSVTSATTSDGACVLNVSRLTADSITTTSTTVSTMAYLAMSGNQEFADNAKAQFGGSQDLEIYHDGTGSIIKESGAGGLSIQGDSGIYIKNSGADLVAAFNTAGGGVNLYYDNAVKLATTALGVTVDSVFSSGDISLQDTLGASSGKVKIGTDDDLQIYHDNTNARIDNGTGALLINSDTAITGGIAVVGATTLAATSITGVTSITGATTLTGATSIASGHLSLGDATNEIGKIKLGTDGDLQLYHTGVDSYIDGATGDLNIRGANLNLQKYTGETFLACVADGPVSVYHNNAVKLATTVAGVNVTGVVQHTVYTHANLPASPAAGMRAFVSDSANPLATQHGLAVVAGAGGNFVPVFYDGTNWIVG